jgi:hypothetical protein
MVGDGKGLSKTIDSVFFGFFKRPVIKILISG